MSEAKIIKGTVTLDGQLYKAFENVFSRKWYIVKGEKSNGELVMANIVAKSGKGAITSWLSTKEDKDE